MSPTATGGFIFKDLWLILRLFVPCCFRSTIFSNSNVIGNYWPLPTSSSTYKSCFFFREKQRGFTGNCIYSAYCRWSSPLPSVPVSASVYCCWSISTSVFGPDLSFLLSANKIDNARFLRRPLQTYLPRVFLLRLRSTQKQRISIPASLWQHFGRRLASVSWLSSLFSFFPE